MKNKIVSNQFSDAHGNPAGGSTYGNGFAISWQNGPLGRGPDRLDPNGAFVEDVIQAAISRLKFYQESRFAHKSNAEAIHHLSEALDWLERRTAEREERAVEGTHAA